MLKNRLADLVKYWVSQQLSRRPAEEGVDFEHSVYDLAETRVDLRVLVLELELA